MDVVTLDDDRKNIKGVYECDKKDKERIDPFVGSKQVIHLTTFPAKNPGNSENERSAIGELPRAYLATEGKEFLQTSREILDQNLGFGVGNFI